MISASKNPLTAGREHHRDRPNRDNENTAITLAGTGTYLTVEI